MPTHSISVPELAQELADAMPSLDEAGARTCLAVYRLLAEGRPVGVDEVAQRAGVAPAQAERLLEEWPSVYRDHEGRVIGFWGLALGGTPHRLVVDGRELSAWCAWDTLFLPGLLGRPASVASTCPVTGETIRLRVGDDGPADVRPAGAVLSFLRREEPFDADTVGSFCHFVHFFASPEAADEWTARNEGTFVMSVEDAFALGRAVIERCYGEALEHQRPRLDSNQQPSA